MRHQFQGSEKKDNRLHSQSKKIKKSRVPIEYGKVREGGDNYIQHRIQGKTSMGRESIQKLVLSKRTRE